MSRRASPNFDTRTQTPHLIILHYTDMEDAAAALDRLCDPAAKVSAHYFIRRTGECLQLVDDDKRAWHAGVSCWRGERDVNSASLGIELDHDGHAADGRMAPFPAVQMQALTALLDRLTARHGIDRRCVWGHSDVAPGRKIDPGEAFDWAALAAAGFGVWPGAVAVENVPTLGVGMEDKAVAPLQKALAGIGYELSADGVYGAATETVVAAFQRHFRPHRIDGTADAETQTLIYAVCRAALADTPS